MARCHQCAAETQRRDDGTNQCPVCYQLIPEPSDTPIYDDLAGS
jgi:hypothetical protein